MGIEQGPDKNMDVCRGTKCQVGTTCLDHTIRRLYLTTYRDFVCIAQQQLVTWSKEQSDLFNTRWQCGRESGLARQSVAKT